MSEEESNEIVPLEDLEKNTVDEELKKAQFEVEELSVFPDRFHFAYLLFFFMGLVILVPWITVLTGSDYFLALYPDYNFSGQVGIAYMYPLAITMGFLTCYGKYFSFQIRIVTSYIVFALAFFLLPIVDLLLRNGAISTGFGYFLTLCFIILIGVSDGVGQGSLYGLSSLFPQEYIQGVSGGSGASAFVVSITRAITKASAPRSQYGARNSTLVYFLISGVLNLLGVVAYYVLIGMPITKFYLAKASFSRASDSASEDPALAAIVNESGKKAIKVSDINLMTVAKKTWKPALMVSWNFVVTLSIIPALISLVPPSSESHAEWFTTVLIITFNVTDFISKMIPRFWTIPDNVLYIATAIRTLLIFMFIICIKTNLLRSEFFPFLFTLLLSITNGYIATRALMIGTSSVEDYEQEVAGIFMAWSLVLGLAGGASLGWIFTAILG